MNVEPNMWWHCKPCGRLFRVGDGSVCTTCPDCGGSPILRASDRHARLAESGVVRSVTYDSKRGVSK